MIRSAPVYGLIILTAVAMSLGGCGRKGPLERPEAAKAAPAVKQAEDATVRGPRRGFILDGLLR